jgi:hypothetical protein
VLFRVFFFGKLSYFYSVGFTYFFNVFPLSATREYAMLPIEHLFYVCRIEHFLSLLMCLCGIFINVSFSCTKVPNLEKGQCKIKTLPSPQWAHLDAEEFQEVVFVCADSPHQFFVRHRKFNDM